MPAVRREPGSSAGIRPAEQQENKLNTTTALEAVRAMDAAMDAANVDAASDAAFAACIALGVGEHRLADDLVVWVNDDGSVDFGA